MSVSCIAGGDAVRSQPDRFVQPHWQRDELGRGLPAGAAGQQLEARNQLEALGDEERHLGVQQAHPVAEGGPGGCLRADLLAPRGPDRLARSAQTPWQHSPGHTL